MRRATKGTLSTAAVAMVGLSLMLLGIAAAQETGQATVTVTASQLAINVTDGSAALGTVPVGGTGDTTATGTNDDLAYNNPTTSVEYATLGINAEQNGTTVTTTECDFGGDPEWDLVDTFTVTNDEFQLDADHDDDGLTTPTALTADNVPATLATNVAADGNTHNVDLEITLDDVISTLGAACTIEITLTATS